MFSVADMAVAGVVALLLFGPDQLPKVARKAGQLVRDVQNTSQSFIRELERAADEQEAPVAHTPASDLPLPPIAEGPPSALHLQPIPESLPSAVHVPPIPSATVHEALTETPAVETIAPVRHVAAPIESAGVAQHNAIVDTCDLETDLKADQKTRLKATTPATDSHTG